MGYQVLLITGSQNTRWGTILNQSIEDYGDLLIVTDADYGRSLSRQPFDLIIIDASEVAETTQVVRETRRQQPDSRVIVVTASPTWQRARDAMQAGATDYLRKTQNVGELHRYLRTQFPGERTLPPKDIP